MIGTGHIAFVDFHDARLSGVELLAGGLLRIAFSKINVFERTDTQDRFDVWTYRITLVVERVERLQCQGLWSSEAYVDEMTRDGRDVEGDPSELAADGESHEFFLAFFGGHSIEWTGTRASLEVSERVKFVETWNGPLDT